VVFAIPGHNAYLSFLCPLKAAQNTVNLTTKTAKFFCLALLSLTLFTCKKEKKPVLPPVATQDIFMYFDPAHNGSKLNEYIVCKLHCYTITAALHSILRGWTNK